MSTPDNDSKKTNSLSKVLPSVGNFSFLGMSTKMAERSNSLAGTTEKPHSIFVQEYSLISEFNLLKHHPEPGVYVIPAAKTPYIWFGVIFIRSGVYEGGIFRFRITIPQSFPFCTICPKVVFETPVFHTLVDPTTGELNLKNMFFEWKRDVNHIWQIISYIRSIFHDVQFVNAIDKRAESLCETNREEFLKLVKNCVDNSKVRIYEKPLEEDPHYFVFDEFNEEVHQPFKDNILKDSANSHDSNEPRSISWVQPGSLEPLSKPNSN